jgi:hypothetical protein
MELIGFANRTSRFGIPGIGMLNGGCLTALVVTAVWGLEERRRWSRRSPEDVWAFLLLPPPACVLVDQVLLQILDPLMEKRAQWHFLGPAVLPMPDSRQQFLQEVLAREGCVAAYAGEFRR